MELDLPNIDAWRVLHARAREAFRRAEESITNPTAPSPSGNWTAADIVAHIRSGHGENDSETIEDLIELEMQTLDLAVHSWDVQRSQGIKLDLDGELASALHKTFEPFVELMAQENAFEPPIEVGADASPTEKLIALTGRDPDWAPGR